MRYRFVRFAFAVLLVASGCPAATLGLQPYLQNAGEDRVSILWTTVDGPGRGEVRFSKDSSFDRIAASQARHFSQEETRLPYEFWLHRVDLTNLEAGTAYRYRVYEDGSNVTPAAAAQDELRFTTAGPGPVRFLVFGDSGDGAPVELDLTRRMAAENPAFVLHAGDLAYEDGTFLQLHEFFFRVYQGLASRFPFFTVPGNHDYQFRSAAPYLAMFVPPDAGVPVEGRGRYYSFDWGPIHVTTLDSNQPLLDAATGSGPMLQWLERDLRSTQRQWRVAIFHHTPFPNTHHVGDENCAKARALIAPILERHGVHLVLSGHEHIYQRAKPQHHTVYITTGGGGYALHPAEPRSFTAVTASVPHYLRVDVAGSGMKVQAVSLPGDIVDDFSLSSLAQISEGGIGNAASFAPALAPGGLITILGKDLIRAGETTGDAPFPSRLSGLRVLLGEQGTPLLYVSRSQVNAQIPYGLLGGTVLALEGPNGTMTQQVTISETAPAVFQVTHRDHTLPAIVHADGSLVRPEFPAVGGEALSLYLTGLGAVSPSLPAGFVAPYGILYSANSPVTVTVDNEPADVLFAGLAPGLVGVNQINFIVPRGVAGERVLTIKAGSANSAALALHCR